MYFVDDVHSVLSMLMWWFVKGDYAHLRCSGSSYKLCDLTFNAGFVATIDENVYCYCFVSHHCGIIWCALSFEFAIAAHMLASLFIFLMMIYHNSEHLHYLRIWGSAYVLPVGQ